jgi:hypothetical protein
LPFEEHAMSDPFRELHDYATSVIRFLTDPGGYPAYNARFAKLKLLTDLTDPCIATAVDGFDRPEVERRVRALREALGLALLLPGKDPDRIFALCFAMADVRTLFLVTEKAAGTGCERDEDVPAMRGAADETEGHGGVKVEDAAARLRQAFPQTVEGYGPAAKEEHDRHAERVADEVARRLRPQEMTPPGEWDFSVPGQFRYKDCWHDLGGQSLRLLKAFVEARRQTLTHHEVRMVACGDDNSNREHAYVSELNTELKRCWGLEENPVRPVSGDKAYRLHVLS